MTLTMDEAKKKLLRTQTETSVFFDGKRVGFAGKAKHGNKRLFLWSQISLRFMSTNDADAYAMSIPLIEKLESLGVEYIFVMDRQVVIPFRQLKEGPILSRYNPTFHTPNDYDQRYILIPHTEEQLM